MADRPLVVLAVGNESRGDDALGPMLAARLEPWLPKGAAVVVDFQLQVEHALELKGAKLALFVDATCVTDSPFIFREVSTAGSIAALSHALEPQAVLAVFQRLEGTPPPAFVLGVRAHTFELGEKVSERARQDLEAAAAFAGELLREPDAQHWRARIG